MRKGLLWKYFEFADARSVLKVSIQIFLCLYSKRVLLSILGISVKTFNKAGF